jgi:hypothetical protein
MSYLKVSEFKDIYGDSNFEKLSFKIGNIESCLEYENFYTLGTFDKNILIAQIYKDKQVYKNVYSCFKKIRKNPIVKIKIENPYNKGVNDFKEININYSYYMIQIKYFDSDLNAAFFNPYIDFNYYNKEYEPLINNNKDSILWRYFVVREGLKNINININSNNDILNFAINVYGFVYFNVSNLEESSNIKFLIPKTLNDFIDDFLIKNNYPIKEGLDNLTYKYNYEGLNIYYRTNLNNFRDIIDSVKVDKNLKDFKPFKSFKIENFIIQKFSILNFLNRNLNIDLFSDVLKNDYKDYNKMQAISCLIISAINSISPFENYPSSNIQNWLLDIKSIGEGVQGNVYFANLFSEKIPISFKISKEKKVKDCSLRRYFDFRAEYFKSVVAINKLREFVPTFMYTFTMFDCYSELDSSKIKGKDRLINLNKSTICLDKNPKHPFILTEKILGKTIHDSMIDGNIQSREKFLCIIQQILLSLEVAQSTVGFCHHDLHGKNLILRPVPDGYTYSVLLNNKKITVKDPKFIPVFIDFGFASCKIKGEQYGKNGFEQNGIFNFLIPCKDHLKILMGFFYYAVNYSNITVYNAVLDILSSKVTGNYFTNDEKKISTIMNRDDSIIFLMSKGDIASKTPLELLESIQREIGCKQIVIEERREFKLYNFKDTVPDVFDKLYRDENYKSNKDLSFSSIIKEYSIDSSSFIKTFSNYKILKEYYINNKNKDLYEYLKIIENVLKIERDFLINEDIEYLEKIFQIQLPDKNEFYDKLEYLKSLNISVLKHDDIYNIIEMKNMISKFFKMKDYIYYFYKIKQFNISEFNEWVNKFVSSENFKRYNEELSDYVKMDRWCESLENGIEVYERRLR